MIKLYTEQEIFTSTQFQALKLARLYKKDRELFDQLLDYLPLAVHVNERGTLNMTYASKTLADYFDLGASDIYQHGFSLIKTFLREDFMNRSLEQVSVLDKSGDPDHVCNILQLVRIKGDWTINFTQKMILDDWHYFSVCPNLKDLGKPGFIINELLDEYMVKKGGLQKYQSLTQREKRILVMLADGLSNKEVAEQLSISILTVQTHRKVIYTKLDASSVADLVKYQLAFDML